MQQHSASLIGSRSLALLGIACAFSVSSCSDEDSFSWWRSKDKATEPAAAEAEVAPTTAQESVAAASSEQLELLDYMIYSVADMVRREASNPAWRDEVRDMRNRLEEYYNALAEKGADAPALTKLGLFLADTTRDLSAFQKAQELYEKTLTHWEAASEEYRNSIAGRRARSAIANGIGSCLLAQRKASEALPYYENALELDRALFEELAPADKAPLPAGDDISPDLLHASEDILSSYRCLAECQLMAEDPEEARDTFKRGQELVLRMKHLKPGMSIQYIRLLSSLGNLESSVGQLRQAYAAWMNAANIAQRLQQVAPTAAIKLQANRYYRELEASIKSIAKELQETLKSEQADQAEGAEAPAAE